MKKIPKKIVVLLVIVTISLIFILNIRNIYSSLPINLKQNIRDLALKKYKNLSERNKVIIRASSLEPFPNLESRYRRGSPSINNLNNDYNVKFLPETQRGKFDLSLIQINLKENDLNKNNTAGLGTYGFFKPFFLEITDNNLISTNIDGDFIFIEMDNFLKKENKNLKFKPIKSNLKVTIVMGTLLDENNLYVSYMVLDNECQRYNIASAKINFNKLIFKDIFNSNVCGNNLRAGRMQIFEHKGSKGLLATIGGEGLNNPTDLAQSLDSDMGKIIFINLENSEKIIYSYGHRNPQGLLVDGNIVLATEHGPYGGDEINKITYGKNYGWPIASYGTSYPSIGIFKKHKFTREEYLKSHEDNNFEEPIFSFVPSIGISQIIKVPNNYTSGWIDNYLVSSLNDGSLYRIKFDKNFTKIVYSEKIFINKRIRDLKYSKKYNVILLALEDWQEIGILKPLLEN